MVALVGAILLDVETMTALLNLLILTNLAGAATSSSSPLSTDIYCCSFERQDDQNYDRWPDGWIRQRGPGYPHYLRTEIVDGDAFDGSNSLEIELNGGNAALFGPLVPVDTLHRYVLRGAVKTEGLEHDRAFVSLTFLDADQKPLQQIDSTKVRTQGAWERLVLEPVATSQADVHFARIGLHVIEGDRADLSGRVRFDNLCISELPLLELSSNRPLHLYTANESVTITCRLSGVGAEPHEIRFMLLDPIGRVLAEQSEAIIASRAIGSSSSRRSEGASDGRADLVGSCSWQPPIPGPGFYQVRCTLNDSSAEADNRTMGLAIIEPESGSGGEFGWSMPTGSQPLPTNVLAELLPHVGIGWLKFPVWFSAENPEETEQLVRFVERLSIHDIRLIGMLNDPPPEVRRHYGQAGELAAAELFTPDGEPWYDSLERVLLRLSMKIRHWQLGADDDRSFAVYRDLAKRMVPIKQKMESAGQRLTLGFGWDWLFEPPRSDSDAWQFLSFSTEPPLTAARLGDYLVQAKQPGVQRWVVLEPLPDRSYALPVRAKDLVERMMAAKIHGADAIFAANVFDERTGLMHRDGSPSPLLMPWRTTSLLLGGARHVGSLNLPSGSRNHLFERDRTATLVLWSERPSEEILFLGEHAQHCDLWGRHQPLASEDRRQKVVSGPLPSFVTGVHPSVARWRMSTQFAADRMPSILGEAHENALRLENTFPVGVSGRVQLVTNGDWRIDPEMIEFNLAAGESFERPILLRLPYNANSGRHDVRLDFELTADRVYEFSVHRELQIGLGDVSLEVTTRLRDDGYLVVEQKIVNQSDTPVNFSCNLFAPGRKRKRSHVVQLVQGEDVQTYLFPDGEQLLDEWLWIRADEVRGSRVLSKRFIAER